MRIQRVINHMSDVLDVQGLCAAEDRVFVAGTGGAIYALSRDGLLSLSSNGWGMCTALFDHCLAAHECTANRDVLYADPALSLSHGALYAIKAATPSGRRWLHFDDRIRGACEIVAFDHESLKVRHTFGEEALRGGAAGLAATDDALFVGDQRDHCVHVFSHAGTHLRQVRGPWMEPRRLRSFRGRLYLLEERRESLPTCSATAGRPTEDGLEAAQSAGDDSAPMGSGSAPSSSEPGATAGSRVVVLTAWGSLPGMGGAGQDPRD